MIVSEWADHRRADFDCRKGSRGRKPGGGRRDGAGGDLLSLERVYFYSVTSSGDRGPKKYRDAGENSADKPLVVVLVGPTASGKTAWAKWLASKLKASIISVDSAQVYRGCDIGTAKDKSFKQELIDICDPARERMTASRFQELVYTKIEAALRQGRVPVLIGGTGMYLDAILKGYHFPLGKKRKGQFRGRLTPPPYRFVIIGPKVSRAELYVRIEQRTKRMLKQGLIAEVRRLMRRVPASHPVWRTIGYREARAAITNNELRITNTKLAGEIIRVTKVLVRRQGNWLKRWPVRWLGTKQDALRLVRSALGAQYRGGRIVEPSPR